MTDSMIFRFCLESSHRDIAELLCYCSLDIAGLQGIDRRWGVYNIERPAERWIPPQYSGTRFALPALSA